MGERRGGFSVKCARTSAFVRIADWGLRIYGRFDGWLVSGSFRAARGLSVVKLEWMVPSWWRVGLTAGRRGYWCGQRVSCGAMRRGVLRNY